MVKIVVVELLVLMMDLVKATVELIIVYGDRFYVGTYEFG